MPVQQFSDGEVLGSVRTKLNQNDVQLDARLVAVEAAVEALDGAYIEPLTGIPESDLATPLVDKINAAKALPGVNTDITSLGGITGGVAEVDFVRFDTTPETVPTTPGTVFWDSAENAQTLSVTMAGTAGTTLQLGQEQYYRVKASSAISDGQVVAFNGAQGNSGLMLGVPAAGIPVNRPELILGIATESIANNATGYVTQFGLVRNINTTGTPQGEDWNDGDTLYYNPLTVGGLTKVRPITPNPMVVIGNVINSATNGSIFVRVHHGSTLGYSDGNVQITNPQQGDALIYNSSSQRWENAQVSSGGTGGITQAFADGRYIRTVNGVGSDSSGNVVVDLGEVIDPGTF
jgi:hypothetical protein